MWSKFWKFRGLLLAMFLMAFVAAFAVNVSLLQAAHVPDVSSLAVQNVSPLDLTIILETELEERVLLGKVGSGQILVFQDALLRNNTPLAGQQFTIHAKDGRNSEFFTIYIDRDELDGDRVNRVVTIPGPGGRRQRAMAAPTSAPLPTPLP